MAFGKPSGIGQQMAMPKIKAPAPKAAPAGTKMGHPKQVATPVKTDRGAFRIKG